MMPAAYNNTHDDDDCINYEISNGMYNKYFNVQVWIMVGQLDIVIYYL
jgi:hypothetical protein